MGRLIGYVANRTDRLAEALTEEDVAVGPASSIVADAWGIGFYQGGEVLHKKRPHSVARDTFSWSDVAGDVKTDCAVIHFRTATVGDYRAENTHPFRMRQWIFAHNGTVNGFEAVREALIESMPDFLRRNVRGTTDSEHVFHSLLSFLHDSGQLDNPDIDARTVLGAIRATIARIDRLVSEVGAPPATLNFVLTNGRQMFAVRRGGSMHFVTRERTLDARSAANPFRYVMVVSNGPDAPADWRALQDGEALVIGRDLETACQAL
jgi:glutamine amidotransferase